MFFRLVVVFLWCLSWLPFRVLGGLGWVLGSLLYVLPSKRRLTGETNLRLCFPELDAAARADLLRRHFIAMAQMLLEYAYCWFASRERLEKLVRIEGLEHLRALGPEQAAILQMPHFTGLDLAGLRLSLETPVVSIYARQKNPWLDAFFLRKRLRFNTGVVFSRQQGVRASLRALKQGLRLYYLPDQDHGARDSIFVDFFGVPAATITGLSRLASAANAQVLPCYPRRTATGYVIVVEPPMAGFPSGDLRADTRRMNETIERQARTLPAQYFWLHKRFKTRPPGMPSLYDRPSRPAAAAPSAPSPATHRPASSHASGD